MGPSICPQFSWEALRTHAEISRTSIDIERSDRFSFWYHQRKKSSNSFRDNRVAPLRNRSVITSYFKCNLNDFWCKFFARVVKKKYVVISVTFLASGFLKLFLMTFKENGMMSRFYLNSNSSLANYQQYEVRNLKNIQKCIFIMIYKSGA